MPRVTLTESQRTAARWRDQDAAIAQQIRRIQSAADMTKGALAAYLGLTPPTLAKYMRQPGDMPKRVERKLVLLAERVGMTYDPGLGGRKASAEAANMRLTIDPATGYLRAM